MDALHEHEPTPEPQVPPAARDVSPLETLDWTDEMGRRWLTYIDQFESMLAPVGKSLFEIADFKHGQRVIDVGCGAGPTTLEIARRVSPGIAVGLDVSPTLIEAANQRAVKPGALPKTANVRFVLGDATTIELDEPPFDILFSRFGLMFFEDPYRAFEHMRTWLKPHGRIAFACWAPQQANSWIVDVHRIVERYIDMPPMQPNAPGPFGLADVARINDILAWAELTDVEIRTWRGELPIGGPGSNPIRATEFFWNALHVGQLMAPASDNVKASVRRDIEAMLALRHGPSGVVVPATGLIVTARNRGR